MYVKTSWLTGDIVTQAKINNLETQYDGVFDTSAKTATGAWTFQFAVAAASADGLVLATTTPATVGAQKYSPRLRQRGFGWATGSSASMAVDFAREVRPVQGASAPTGNLVWSAAINGGSYADLLTLSSIGDAWVANGGSLGFSDGYISRVGANSAKFWNGTALGTVAVGAFKADGDLTFTGVTASATRYIITDENATGTARLTIQAGGGSAGYGGGINLYAHAHATAPGWVRVGISSGSGGKFAVNTWGTGGGTDVFTVSATGATTIAGNLTYPSGWSATATDSTHFTFENTNTGNANYYFDIKSDSTATPGVHLRLLTLAGTSANRSFALGAGTNTSGTMDFMASSSASGLPTTVVGSVASSGDWTFNGNLTVNSTQVSVTSSSDVQLKLTKQSVADWYFKANTNLSFVRNSSTFLTIDSSGAVSAVTSVAAPFFAYTTNPASAGFIRGGNNQFAYFRNAANSADVQAFGVNSSNLVSIDPAGAGVVFGSSGVQVLTAAGKIQALTSTYFASLAFDAANLTGTVATARLGSGTASSTTFLRGDQTWGNMGIKSIQQGSIDITNGNASATATITAVTLAKAYVVFNGAESAQGGDTTEEPGKWIGSVELTNTTTVTARRGSSVGSTLTVRFTVIEFF